MAADKDVQITIKARDQSHGAFSKLQANIISLNQAWELAKKAVNLVTGAFKAVMEESINASRMMTQVEQNVKNSGLTWDSVKGKLEAYSKAQVARGFDDEAAALSVSKLMLITKDYNQALALNSLAMDLARSKNIDLESATKMVTLVTQGAGRVLKEYGINIKETGTVVEQLDELQRQVAGSADAFANTIPGKIERTKEQWSNMKQEIGDAVLPAVGQLIDKFNDNLPQIIKLVGALASALGAVAGAAVKASGYIVELFEKRVDPMVAATGKTLDAAKKNASAIVKINQSITGTSVLDKFLPANVIASGLAKIKSANEEAASKIIETTDKTKSAFEGLNLPIAGAAGAANKAADDMVSAYQKVKDEISKVSDEIVSLTEKMADAQIQNSKDTYSYKQSLSEAYVAQEQKVKDLEAQWASESNQENKDKLKKELDAARLSLESRKTIELAYVGEVAEARRRASLDDFQRQVEDIQLQAVIRNDEFTQKMEQYKKELDAKTVQMKALTDLENQISANAIAASQSRTNSMVNNIDTLIKKYDALARAATNAYSISSISVPVTGHLPVSRDVGGIVPGAFMGAPVPILAHAGEMVIPVGQSNRNNGGGINISISNPMFLDKYAAEKFADLVMRQLKTQIRV